eukprot:14168794-Alexandrium_andersonii.AAC.1
MATVGHALESTPDIRPIGQDMALGDLGNGSHVGKENERFRHDLLVQFNGVLFTQALESTR